MRPARGRVLRLAIPFRALAQRLALVLLLASALTLLVLGRADFVPLERARTSINDTLAPVLDVLSRPVATLASVVDAIRNLLALHGDNAALRLQNERLRHWQALAQRLEQENVILRDLLHMGEELQGRFVSGRVIGDASGPFVRTVLVNIGRRDGVRRGQAAVTARGVVGRVAEVGDRSARVLLLTDLNSRVPVLVRPSRQRAILAGDNGPRPKLAYLPANARLQPGDQVVTSGQGGVYPPGLPIGIVTLVEDGVARVEPYADWDRLEYVSILEHSPAGIVDPEASPVPRAP